MKSLEIVNEKVKYYKDTIEELLNKNEEYPNPFIHLTLDPLEEKLKKWKTIKQDLEVLEILKEVVFERVGYYKIKGNSPKYRTITIRDNDDRFIKIELSEEEFEKVKQWLEDRKDVQL